MSIGRGVRSFAVLVVLARPGAAQDSSATQTKTASITYLTGTSAYIDAGRLDGLQEEARLEVVRRGATVGELRVAYLASHRASCDIVRAAVALAIGDSVRFSGAAPPRDSTPVAASSRASRAPRPSPSGPGLRGRVGLAYFVMQQRDGTNGSFSQPALDLRIDGPPLGAPSLNLAIDVRARRTYTILSDGTALSDGLNRVYQAAITAQAPGSPARITVGRQISGNLAPVGLFDGVLAEVARPGWSTGVFTGTEPEPLQLTLSSSIMEVGGYVQRHSVPGATSLWSLTLGASGSYDGGNVNRNFAFMQGSYLTPRMSAMVTQEVDYYQAWRLLPGMDPISPTSTFATFQYRATGAVTLNAGFDNRRNVRLYQDVVSPETVFDDTYRQGAWAGAWLRVGRRVRLGVDARQSSGGPGGTANSYTLSLGGDRLTPLGAALRTRTTYYIGPEVRGWLEAAALGFEPGDRLRLELNGGLRAEQDLLASPPNTSVSWVGADLDLTLARAWYVMVSATRQRGGVDGYDEVYGGLSFRF